MADGVKGGRKGKSHKLGRSGRKQSHKDYVASKRWITNAKRKQARRLHRLGTGPSRAIRRAPLQEAWLLAHPMVAE